MNSPSQATDECDGGRGEGAGELPLMADHMWEQKSSKKTRPHM